MSELSDRLIILLLVATLLLGVMVGWGGGFVEAEVGRLPDLLAFGLLGLLFVAILVGVWWGFDVIG